MKAMLALWGEWIRRTLDVGTEVEALSPSVLLDDAQRVILGNHWPDVAE